MTPITVSVVTTWLPTERNIMSGAFVERDIRALSSIARLRVIHLVSPALNDGVIRTRIGDVPVIRIPFTPKNPLSYAKVMPPLQCALRGSDIVHSMAVSSLAPLAGIFKIRPFRSARISAQPAWVHTEHWSGFVCDPYLPSPVQQICGKLIQLPDAVAAVSPYLANIISTLSSRHVDIVPNIIDMPAPICARNTHTSDTIRLIGVGGLIDRKQPLIAVDTCAELTRRGIDSCLTWVGDGPLRESVRARAHERGVQLTLTGTISPNRVAQYVSESDVFILPTRAETFCLAAAEALSLGRPVVVGAVGGQSAFVHPPTGALVTGRNPVDYADAVLHVMRQTENMSADEIAYKVRTRYSYSALIASYKEIYARVLRHLPTGRADGKDVGGVYGA